MPAAPERSAGRTRRRHRCPWAVRQLAIVARASTFGMAYSPVVSCFLMAAFQSSPSSGCCSGSGSKLILFPRSAIRHQAEMPGQHPRDSCRDDKPKPGISTTVPITSKATPPSGTLWRSEIRPTPSSVMTTPICSGVSTRATGLGTGACRSKPTAIGVASRNVCPRRCSCK